MLTQKQEKLIFSSFNQNRTMFIRALNTMLYDSSTPGNGAAKLAAAQDILALVSDINNVSLDNNLQNRKSLLINWFNSASDEGKALLLNAVRYTHDKKYIEALNNIGNIKSTMKSIEQLKAGKHCNYGYGFGLDNTDIDFDEVFG